MNATDFTRQAQEQVLDGIRQSQEAAVKAIEVWARGVEQASAGVQAATASAPPVPNPQEIVESTFDFAERLLAVQREFARSVLAAAAPAFGNHKNQGEGA